ncbi:hypothetical protein C8Q75DRAFT_247099 [Abortiporus biennis]|nr:hypothetical protein C8Q75DRAFT_247099 [Abortiporus biennis]
MQEEEATPEEIEQAVAAYHRDMHAYTLQLWAEVRRQAELRARVEESQRKRGSRTETSGDGSGSGGATALQTYSLAAPHVRGEKETHISPRTDLVDDMADTIIVYHAKPFVINCIMKTKYLSAIVIVQCILCGTNRDLTCFPCSGVFHVFFGCIRSYTGMHSGEEGGIIQCFRVCSMVRIPFMIICLDKVYVIR